MSVSVYGLWTQSAESSVWDQSLPRMPLDNAGRNLGMTILHVVEGKYYNHSKTCLGKICSAFWSFDCVRTCIWRIVFVFQLKFHQQFENSSTKGKETHEELKQCISRLTAHYINGHVVPCIGCQAAEHVCEGGQSERTSLLHQERVFIRRLLCVVLERHTLPPQPVKLTLLKLVPHWENKGAIQLRGCIST